MVFVRSARDGGDMWLWFAHPWPYEIASRLCAKGTVRSGFFDPQLRETTEGLAIAYWFYDIYVRTFVWNHSCGWWSSTLWNAGPGLQYRGHQIRAPTSKPLRPQPWSPEDDGLMALDAWSHIMGLLDCELCPTWRLHHQKVTESPNSGRDHTHRSTQYMFVTLAPPGTSKVQYSLNDSQVVGGLKRRDRMFRCVAQPPTTSSQLLWVEHCNMLMYPYDLPMSSRFAPWYPLKLPASLEIRTIWWRCMIM